MNFKAISTSAEVVDIPLFDAWETTSAYFCRRLINLHRWKWEDTWIAAARPHDEAHDLAIAMQVAGHV